MAVFFAWTYFFIKERPQEKVVPLWRFSRLNIRFQSFLSRPKGIAGPTGQEDGRQGRKIEKNKADFTC